MSFSGTGLVTGGVYIYRAIYIYIYRYYVCLNRNIAVLKNINIQLVCVASSASQRMEAPRRRHTHVPPNVLLGRELREPSVDSLT